MHRDQLIRRVCQGKSQVWNWSIWSFREWPAEHEPAPNENWLTTSPHEKIKSSFSPKFDFAPRWLLTMKRFVFESLARCIWELRLVDLVFPWGWVGTIQGLYRVSDLTSIREICDLSTVGTLLRIHLGCFTMYVEIDLIFTLQTHHLFFRSSIAGTLPEACSTL